MISRSRKSAFAVVAISMLFALGVAACGDDDSGGGDGADSSASIVEDRIGRDVGQPQRHAIARSDADADEHGRHALRPTPSALPTSSRCAAPHALTTLAPPAV